MIQAARKHRLTVQMGNQRHSWAGAIEAVQKLRAGAIGRVTSRAAGSPNQRPSVGLGKAASFAGAARPIPSPHANNRRWHVPGASYFFTVMRVGRAPA